VIIADENLDAKIIAALRAINIDIYSIAELHSGFSDEEVINLTKEKGGVILTRDKDFGEWVFAHHVRDISVVLLRYRFTQTDLIIARLLQLFEFNSEALAGKFTTVTVLKTRSRNIPWN